MLVRGPGPGLSVPLLVATIPIVHVDSNYADKFMPLGRTRREGRDHKCGGGEKLFRCDTPAGPGKAVRINKWLRPGNPVATAGAKEERSAAINI